MEQQKPEKYNGNDLSHLFAVRENILNWYPFKANASCLELTSGSSAVTELLQRKVESVVTVKCSEENPDLDLSEKFDYIVINGVFPYAQQPYETFLFNLLSLLKPTGIILIAIENRLGLKYFAGAPDAHTDGYFDGIRGYGEHAPVRTFSKGEWEHLMKLCGLEHYRFYYPYPDYRFPKEIFTDESLKTQKYGCPSWNFTKYRMALFEEHKMAETLQEEGVISHFANSFLIEMSREALPQDRQVVYAKLSADRAEKYMIGTVLQKRVETAEGERKQWMEAVKYPLSEAAEAHIKQMIHTQEHGDYGSWYVLKAEERGGSLVYPFLKQESFGQQAEQALEHDDMEKVCDLVNRVSEMLTDMAVRGTGCCVLAQNRSEKDREDFRQVFGSDDIWEDTACIAPVNIDLILDNIFEEEGRFCVIDCEWVFDFPIPVSFVIWRAVNELYSRNPLLGKKYPMEEFLQEYDITPEMAERFYCWATYFAEEYVGANRVLKSSIPEIGVSLEEFRQRRKSKEVLQSQLFVDTGNGFSEEQKLMVETDLTDGQFTLEFDLSEFTEIKALRFDPMEGNPCICIINKEISNVKLTADNAVSHAEDGDLFLTTDPIYQVGGGTRAGKICISGHITVLSMEDALNRASQLLQKKNRLGFRSRSWRK